MPSQYLQPSEYPLYGLPESTTTPQVVQASLMVDAYLARPEGIVYATDALGQPIYMTGLDPSATFAAAGAIAPGKAVSVTLSPAMNLTNDFVGQVVILDRASPSLVEACVIQAVAPGGVITLANVVNAHAAACSLDFGLTIFEERSLPEQRSIARVSRPIVRLLSGLGRYGYGRRTGQAKGLFTDVNLLAIIQTFGGPPEWTPFDPTLAAITPTARELWVPAGQLLAYYSSVRLYYVAGYRQTAIPAGIKQAVANIITTITGNAVLQGQLSVVKTGTTSFARFAASAIDNDTRRLIDNYRCLMII